jgi:hypothetical protein
VSCNDKISDRCGKKINAVCVTYEGTLVDDSALTAPGCFNLEVVIEDINEQINTLKDETDLAGLTNTCITYPLTGGHITVEDAIITLDAKLEAIMTYVGMACADCPSCENCSPIFTQDISCVGLDYGLLVDACGLQPTNLKEVLQLLLDQVNILTP